MVYPLSMKFGIKAKVERGGPIPKKPAKRRRGRPRLDESAAKTEMFNIRLSIEERAILFMAAKRAGVRGESEWARAVLLQAARRQLKS